MSHYDKSYAELNDALVIDFLILRHKIKVHWIV